MSKSDIADCGAVVMGMMRIFIPVTNKILPLVMEVFIILEWVSVCSLIISVISGVIGFVSGIINRKFNAEHEKNMIELKDKLEQKMEDDRKEFERDRDKLKREFEKDLLSIKTNFEKEIYTYKARYDHKVEMMKEMSELVDRFYTAGLYVCDALYKELDCFVEKFYEFDAEIRKYKASLCKYEPFVKKEVIENFGRFGFKVNAFIVGVFMFWYERKYLIEKDKNPQDKYGNIDCEKLKREYEYWMNNCQYPTKFCDVRNFYEIQERYSKCISKLRAGLSERIREYLNEK